MAYGNAGPSSFGGGGRGRRVAPPPPPPPPPPPLLRRQPIMVAQVAQATNVMGGTRVIGGPAATPVLYASPALQAAPRGVMPILKAAPSSGVIAAPSITPVLKAALAPFVDLSTATVSTGPQYGISTGGKDAGIVGVATPGAYTEAGYAAQQAANDAAAARAYAVSPRARIDTLATTKVPTADGLVNISQLSYDQMQALSPASRALADEFYTGQAKVQAGMFAGYPARRRGAVMPPQYPFGDVGPSDFGNIFSNIGKAVSKAVKDTGNAVAKAAVDTGHVTGEVVTSTAGKAVIGGLLAATGVGLLPALAIGAATQGVGRLVAPGGNLKTAVTGAEQGAVGGAAASVVGTLARTDAAATVAKGLVSGTKAVGSGLVAGAKGVGSGVKAVGRAVAYPFTSHTPAPTQLSTLPPGSIAATSIQPIALTPVPAIPPVEMAASTTQAQYAQQAAEQAALAASQQAAQAQAQLAALQATGSNAASVAAIQAQLAQLQKQSAAAQRAAQAAAKAAQGVNNAGSSSQLQALVAAAQQAAQAAQQAANAPPTSQATAGVLAATTNAQDAATDASAYTTAVEHSGGGSGMVLIAGVGLAALFFFTRPHGRR